MNLYTHYMGLRLNSPIVVSSCPLSQKIDNILQMEDAGAGAVVLFSLFEEQIKQETDYYYQMMDSSIDIFAETNSYFPNMKEYRVDTEKYLEIIRKAKERVEMPVIASLNGITDEGWIEYAQQMEKAGADGIEINAFFIPADLEITGPEAEKRYLDIIDRVKANVDIPVAIKLNPYFSAMGNMARQLERAGAEALVLFNRFYQPDFDIYELKVNPNLEYSVASEIRLPLLWISVLYGKINASLAATTGVDSATEVIKYLLAGADIAMTASAIMKYGISHIKTMRQDLLDWMRMMEFEDVNAFKGILSQNNVADPTAFERANYIRIIEST